ncbi:MAG: hypothetical protein II285_02775 [Flavobacteriales bacterium]|nr:hypothetical protein [Flavobacteriales bacterium]
MLDIKEIKRPVYEAPEGYFEELEMTVASYVNREIKRDKRHTILRRLYMGVSAAAAIVAIYIGVSQVNYDIAAYRDSIEITSVEELHNYVIDIQENYSSDIAVIDTDVETSKSATEIYLSHIEEDIVTDGNMQGETGEQDIDEILNYNIMELASL